MEIIWWTVLIVSSCALVIVIPYMVLLFVDEIPPRRTAYIIQEPNNTPVLKAAKLSWSEYRRIIRDNKKSCVVRRSFW